MIGNDRRYIGIKSNFLILGLFFSLSSLNAMCPQTVGSISPGEGVWNVLTRVGQATNAIQSQLCSVAGECSVLFGQEDIGAGSVYTITEPGTYCMVETVSFTTGFGITISSDDVTLDLQGYTIKGDGASTTAIQLSGGVQNIIIKNGIIEDMAGSSPNGIGIRDFVGHTSPLRNIVIRDIDFNNNSFAAISLTFAASGFDVEELIIENCHAYNSGKIQAISRSGIVQGCDTYEDRGAGILGGIFFQGLSGAANYATHLIIQDCISTSSASNFVPIQISSATNAIMRNCVIQNNSSALSPINFGIRINGYNHGVISDCIMEQGSFYGIVADDPQGGSLAIERCLSMRTVGPGFEIDNPATTTPVELRDCLAQNCGSYGFLIYNNGTGLFADVVVKNCVAMSNAISGFNVAFDTGPSTIEQVLFEDCASQTNGTHGFSVISGNVLGSPGTNTLTDVVFRNCTAQGNGTDGFGIGVSDPFFANTGPVKNIICENCIAQDNTNGFNLGSTTTVSEIFNCCAMNNSTNGISDSGVGNRIISNRAFNNTGADTVGVLLTTPYASLGSGSYWTNAIS